jgi:hypothetical protein
VKGSYLLGEGRCQGGGEGMEGFIPLALAYIRHSHRWGSGSQALFVVVLLASRARRGRRLLL